MIETTSLLRSYADLILRLSRAGSVTVALSAPREDEPPMIVVDGELPPIEELRDEASVRRVETEFLDRSRSHGADPSKPVELKNVAPECILFRVPALRAADAGEPKEAHGRRRASDALPHSGLVVWVGLRFPSVAKRLAPEDVTSDWWNAILGLAASIAPHAHTVAKVFQDPLTGLPSRSGFRTELALALDESRAGGRPLALMLINPDEYADINRQYGRGEGDATLAEIASRLRRRVRATDRVARYGGATFGVVFVDVDPEAARDLAEDVRRGLSAGTYGDGRASLSFSVGLACVEPDDNDDGDLVVEWTRRADEALFQAKLEGGARTTTWSPDQDHGRARTVDRLQGMFTGDVNTDYRNMALLWEVVQSIADGGEPEELCARVVEGLYAWLRARVVAIVEPETGGGARVMFAAVEGEQPSKDWILGEAALRRITNALRSGEPQITRPDPDADEHGACAVPLLVDDRRTGCIYLEGDSETSSGNAPATRFLMALAAPLAIALDRTRVDAIERVREAERREILESEVKELRRVLQSTRLSYTSDSMHSVLDAARRIAPTDATVLITGESGTGKELLARTIHQLSERSDQPMIVVDCGAITTSLIDSELFGHVRGAFTGAHARKTGRLVEADGATVFLDEIAELPTDVQSKLLRFVQERQITPVGGTRPVKIDTRIVAATNVDLSERVKAGTFREDLYHRLNVVRLHLPPLRERQRDIRHLASQFLQQYATLYRKEGLRLAPEAEQALMRHRWTGNVRELQNRMMRAVLFADDGVVCPEHFEGLHENGHIHAPVVGVAPATPVRNAPAAASPEEELRQALDREIDLALENGATGRPLGKWLETDLIVAADRAASGVSRRAGSMLGLPDTTYRRRLGKADRERGAGLDVRTKTWDSVRTALDRMVSESEELQGELAACVERIALEAIVRPCSNDLRTGALLLGVSEPTYVKKLTVLGIRGFGDVPL